MSVQLHINFFSLALDYGGTKHTAALLIPGERAWLAHGRAR